MVHKKSEYRLNYKWIPSDICHRTWETGNTYRVQRRRYDLSHLPLPWEGAACDCDVDDDEPEANLPIPKTRLKHNVLTESRVTNATNGQVYADDDEWYRRWEEMEHRYTPLPMPPPLKLKQSLTENFPPCQSVRFTNSKDKVKSMPSLLPAEDVHSSPYVTNHVAKLKPNGRNKSSNVVKEKMMLDEQQQQINAAGSERVPSPVQHRGTQTPPRCWAAPRSPRIMRTDLCETVPSASMDRPKMIPYGWASGRAVGDKKTFNIYAPTGNPEQFHSSALRAWKRKEIDMHRKVDEMSKQTERYLESFKYDRHQPTNPSSIWMTEYQQQYREEPKVPRPMSAPPSRVHRLGTIYHQCCL